MLNAIPESFSILLHLTAEGREPFHKSLAPSSARELEMNSPKLKSPAMWKETWKEPVTLIENP